MKGADWSEKYAKHQAIQGIREAAHDTVNNWMLEEEDDSDLTDAELAELMVFEEL